MSLIQLTRPDRATDHMIAQWMTGEVCRVYVEQRRRFWSHLELLDLYCSAPLCESCAWADPFSPSGPPDISPRSWKDDIAWVVGEDVLATVRKERRKDANFGFICKRCSTTLQPWAGDDVYVVSCHVEDHYRFPLIRPGQIRPSRTIEQHIKDLYGNRCFSCKRKRPLHVDHINPRSNGGDGAFRNLQSLCEPCGQAKGNRIPKEVGVHDTMYFGPYPSDGYEGLFW
jgi:HNH endonuclease